MSVFPGNLEPKLLKRFHLQWDWFIDRTYKCRIWEWWLSATWPVEQRKSKCSQEKARWRGCKMKENVLAPIHVLFWDLVTYWDFMRLFCILIINLFLLNLVQIFFYHQFVIANYIWLNILVRRFKTDTLFCGKHKLQ